MGGSLSSVELGGQVLGNNQKGFTLLELMIAVAIIGILLSIAIPEYRDYLRRGARSAAQAYLSDLAQRQELRFQDARLYSNVAADFPPLPPDLASRYSAPAFVAVAPAAGVPASYTITLVPQSGLMAADGTLTINNQGVRKRGAYDW